MTTIPLRKLTALAVEKPPGWLDQVLRASRQTASHIEIDTETWQRLSGTPQPPPKPEAAQGDVDDALAGEIYRATGQRPCRGCGR